MRWFVRSSLALVTALMVLTALASPPAAADRCGRPGRPPCPLQAWMRSELAAPRYSKDWERLATNLERLARHNPRPDEWQAWSESALTAARAARAERRGAVDEQCRACHGRYRRPYRDAFAEREPPAGGPPH